MNINKLIDSIKDVYRDSLQSEKEKDLYERISLELKNTTKKIFEVKEKHKSMDIDESVTEKVINSFAYENNELKKKIESLTKFNRNDVLKNSTNKYLESVNSFTDSGGKGFYDIGSKISFRSAAVADFFKSEIKKMIDGGDDFKIIREARFKHDKDLRHNVSAVYSLVMPSSLYSKYEDFLIKYLPEYDDLALSKENYFIAPFIMDRDDIPEMTKIAIKKSNHFGVTDFLSFGYLAAKIDVIGGYADFDTSRPDIENLKESINNSLVCLNTDLRNFNFMTSTIFCYDPMDSKNLGLDINERNVKNVSNDLFLIDNYHTLENTTVLKTKRKP